MTTAQPAPQPDTLNLDADVTEAREDAIVRRLVDGGPFSLVIPGGGHDLSDNVPASVEHVRLMANSYRPFDLGN